MFQGFKKVTPYIWMRLKVEVKSPSVRCVVSKLEKSVFQGHHQPTLKKKTIVYNAMIANLEKK